MAEDIDLFKERHAELKQGQADLKEVIRSLEKASEANKRAIIANVTVTEAIKKDTSAIVKEFNDRAARMNALGWYASSLESFMKNVIRPVFIIGAIGWACLYALANGHLPSWAKDVIEALK